MVKDNLEDKIRAVLLYTEGSKGARDVSSVMGVSIRTVRRWIRKYNHWRKNQTLGWKTPAFVYHDKRYFGKRLRMASKE